MKESALVQQLLSYLRFRGHKVFRMNAGKIVTGNLEAFRSNSKRRFVQLAPAGCPDIIGWQKGTGKFIGIECKVGKNRRTSLQEQFAKDMQEDGCIYVLAYSLSDIEKVL